jgi:Leucine-rich repeat (LRR) protein
LTEIDGNAFDGLSNLTQLYLSDNALTVNGLAPMVFAPVPHLVVLSLSAAGPVLDASGAWGSDNNTMTDLRSLLLARTGQTDSSLDRLPWHRWVSLKTVDLSGNPDVTDVPQALIGLSSLDTMFLRGTRLGSNASLPASLSLLDVCDGAIDLVNLTVALAGMKVLQTLSACNGSAAAKNLLPLPHLTSLLSLDLTASGLTDVDARAWVSAPFLGSLTLNDNPSISLAGRQPFGGLSQLRALELSGCGLNTFSSVSHLAGLTTLIQLDLSFNNLTTVRNTPHRNSQSNVSIRVRAHRYNLRNRPAAVHYFELPMFFEFVRLRIRERIVLHRPNDQVHVRLPPLLQVADRLSDYWLAISLAGNLTFCITG